MSEAPAVTRIRRLDFELGTERWRFADQNRAAIDDHFEGLRRKRPKLWNGRVLMLGPHAIDGETLSGVWFETDYASMLAWDAWGAPDDSVRNCFAQGALRGADGGFLLGVMAPHTAHAGCVYFPSGTPDRHDVVGHRVDLDASLMREVEEETGLRAGEYATAPLWHAIDDRRGRLALIRVLQLDQSAEQARSRILAHLSSEAEPELADIRIAYGPADLDPQMPAFVRAFLLHVWHAEAGEPLPNAPEIR